MIRWRKLDALLFFACALPGIHERISAEDVAGGRTPEATVNATIAAMAPNSWHKLPARFDPKYSEYGGFNHPHGESAMVYDEHSRRVVWWGGCSSGYCNQTWILNLATETWKEGNPDRYKVKDPSKGIYGGKYVLDDTVPQGGCSYGAAFVPELKGILYGPAIGSGWIAPPEEISRTLKPSNGTWVYRALDNKWEKMSPASNPNQNFPKHGGCYTLCYDSKHKCVFKFAGSPGSGGLCSDLYEYDPSSHVWTAVKVNNAPPPVRKYHTWVFDETRGVCIAHGGSGKDGALADLWEYNHDTRTWKEIKTDKRPPDWSARCPAAFDSKNGALIKYCGRKDGPSETWVFDTKLSEWQKMEPTVKPEGLANMYQTCYDKNHNVAVVVANYQTWIYRYK